MRWHSTIIALMLSLVACLAVGMSAARAQDETFAGSYITPFPKGDVYRVRIVGDRLAQGLVPSLAAQMSSDPRVRINNQYMWFNRVIRQDFPTKLNALIRDLKLADTNIAIVMMGPGDRRSVRVKGKKYWPGQDPWRREYTRRIDTVMKALKQANIAVYWVGLPILRKANANQHAQIMNEVIRERAYINGLKYIDAYGVFIDEQGRYSSYGPDLAGKIRLLRERDGVHLTYAGSQKLAHFIQRGLKRDVKFAREERSEPLAGGPLEQERIRQAVSRTAQRGGQAAKPAWQTNVSENDQNSENGAPALSDQAAIPGGYFGGNGVEQRADNSKIELRTRNINGREQNLKFEILRPAIPSSVVALVTRKQSRNRAAQMGERLTGQIAGGLNVISTVSPANAAVAAGQRRKLSPTQTPFFRVLVRGERLQPKSGRADDLSWPKAPPGADKQARSQPAGQNQVSRN